MGIIILFLKVVEALQAKRDVSQKEYGPTSNDQGNTAPLFIPVRRKSNNKMASMLISPAELVLENFRKLRYQSGMSTRPGESEAEGRCYEAEAPK